MISRKDSTMPILTLILSLISIAGTGVGYGVLQNKVENSVVSDSKSQAKMEALQQLVAQHDVIIPRIEAQMKSTNDKLDTILSRLPR